jgi:hypothetical protein
MKALRLLPVRSHDSPYRLYHTSMMETSQDEPVRLRNGVTLQVLSRGQLGDSLEGLECLTLHALITTRVSGILSTRVRVYICKETMLMLTQDSLRRALDFSVVHCHSSSRHT